MTIQTLDIGLVRSDISVMPELEELIESSGLPHEKYTITTRSMDPGECHEFDTVFAIYDELDDFGRFVEVVSKMKLVCHVPIVIAIIPRSFIVLERKKIESLPVDMLLESPVARATIEEALHTLMAVHDIEAGQRRRFKNKKPLGAILVENEVITSYQLSQALEYAEKESVRIGEALVELGIVPEDRMIWFLGAQIGVEVATVQHYTLIDKNASRLIAESFAEHNLCIPFKEEDGDLYVIMADPKNLQLLDRLRDITEKRIVPFLGRNVDIVKAVSRTYKSISTDAQTTELFKQNQVDFTAPDLNGGDFSDENDEGVIKLVKIILSNASRDRASDIHIEPRDTDLVIRYRIDGELHRTMNSPLNSARPLITRLKIMADLDIAERRLPQDGRFVISLEDQQIDARLSILPTVFGEKAVIRILDSSGFGGDLSHLGIPEQELALLRSQIQKPYGLIVITGPTGSGKTTTLYSALQELIGDSRNIVSVEDPVEYRMPEVSQVQVNSATGLTFAKALRSILRQDPDVVMIGEIRDAETADIAVKMALTGHLVFATLHTNDAPSAITRFVNIGVSPLLLSSCLNLVIAQRLVKRICPECREEVPVPEHISDQLGTQLVPHKNYHGKGCVSCHTSGYTGRVGIYEMLQITPKIRDMILKEDSESAIREEGEKNGMSTLFKSGMYHVENGVTSLEQVLTFLE